MFFGKAWQDDRFVAEAQGASIEEVFARLQATVDKTLHDRATEVTGPLAQHYLNALKSALPLLSDGHVAMLRAHYRASDRSLTATQLAEAAGYANYNAANLQYGFVGKMIWEEVPIDLETRPDGTPIFTFALAVPGNKAAPEDQWIWKMRPELAEAVSALGLHN